MAIYKPVGHVSDLLSQCVAGFLKYVCVLPSQKQNISNAQYLRMIRYLVATNILRQLFSVLQ